MGAVRYLTLSATVEFTAGIEFTFMMFVVLHQ